MTNQQLVSQPIVASQLAELLPQQLAPIKAMVVSHQEAIDILTRTRHKGDREGAKRAICCTMNSGPVKEVCLGLGV